MSFSHMHRSSFSFIFLVVFAFSHFVLSGQGDDFAVDKEVINKVWYQKVADFNKAEYQRAVVNLVKSYESSAGVHFAPGEKGKVGIKIYTNSGAGLSTPPLLIDAMIDFLESRGFSRRDLFILDISTDALWRSGFITSRANPSSDFNGVPVYALDEGVHYDSQWFYDSPLPSQYITPIELKAGGGYDYDASLQDDRKSFLPVPLLLDVDFWINMPVIMDHPELGINGTLANSTLWNISNQFRFMKNPAGASAAIAEIAAIPELKRGLAFSIVSLERVQYMGGPVFNSGYVRSFNEVYLSDNAVALDRIFLEKINRARTVMGFAPISPLPPVFEYAKSLNLGDFENGTFEVLEIK